MRLRPLYYVVLSASAAIAAAALPQLAARATTIPLETGMTLVEAGPGKTGDYEAIYRIEAVSKDGVSVSLSMDPQNAPVKRFVRSVDLAYAHRCMCSWSQGQPRTFAGTTAFGTSAAVLRDLQARGSTLFVDMWQQAEQKPPYRFLTQQSAGVLTRVTDGPETSMVLVNDRMQALPVLHAAGRFQGTQVNFYWLNDPANPVLIHGDVGGGGGRIVKIYLPAAGASARLEQTLRRNQAATLYGVYFETAAAGVRPESGPALHEIADVMRRNPTWRLRLAVHTDNLGGWDANLTLAQQRAQQLVRVLTEREGVASQRLQSVGAGAANPLAGNLTVAGRALNRRVVISRF